MVLEKFNQKAFESKDNAIWLNVAGETLRYSEQIVRLQKLHYWLQVNGIFNNKPILVAVEDDFERASLLMALISSGRLAIILDPTGTQYERNQILTDCYFCAVIAEEVIYQQLNLSSYEVPYLKIIKPKKTTGVFGRLLGKKANKEIETSWPNLPNGNVLSESIKASSDDLAYIVFTSGTTSKPKGVEIQYGALLSQMAALKKQYELSEVSRLLNTLPLHHVDGFLQGPAVAWYSGASVHRPCVFSTQHLASYLNSIYRERITHLIAVPTMLSVIHRLGREWGENFTSPDFQFVVSSAGHLEVALWKSFETDFNVQVVNMYGLSETGASALFSGPDDDSRRLGTIGKSVNSEIRIIDNGGHPVIFGEVGELLISSPQLMKGYHGDAQSSSQVLQNGWLSSGDLVKQLDTGHIELVGRKKNQIISGGKNISPEEVAEVINLHANVVESIVLGQVDHDWGESVAALIVCADEKASDIELTSWCRNRLSEFKVPKHLYIVNELVKGPSGKILVREAREELDRQMIIHAENNAQHQTIDSQVRAIAASVFRIEQAELHDFSSPENTVGWDSLAHMELIVELEKAFGIYISTHDIMHINSIEHAIDICRQQVER